MRVEYIDSLASESRRKSQDGGRISPAAVRAERKGRYTDLTEACLQPACRLQRADLHPKSSVIRVLCNQTEVTGRLRVGNEVEHPDRGVGLAWRSEHWISLPDARGPSCHRT